MFTYLFTAHTFCSFQSPRKGSVTSCVERQLFNIRQERIKGLLLYTSLRSKRFQTSYCAKVRAEAKKRLKGEGEGFVRSPPPPPLLFFFFSLLSRLSRRTPRGNACYAGYLYTNISSLYSKRFPCFRLVPELKKTEERDFRFWPREK